MNSTDLRELTIEDQVAFSRLCRYAFSGEETYNIPSEDLWPSKEYFDEGKVVGIFDNDTLASGSLCHDYELFIRGSLFKMGGIAGVATSPQYRNRGYVRQLLIAWFQRMQQNKVPISVLYAFKYSYYEKFGYRIVDERNRYQFESKLIKFKPIDGYKVIEFYNREEFLKIIKPVYEQIAAGARGYNYMVKRDERNWKKRFKKGFLFVCFDNQKVAKGYVVFFPQKCKTLDAEEDHFNLGIKEIFWLNGKAKQVIFNLMGTHRDHRKYVMFSCAEKNVYSYLKEGYIKEHRVLTNSMARIIDVVQVLSKIHYPKLTTNISFRISDKQCSWNEGTFELNIEEGKAVCQKRQINDPNVSIDIGPLSQLIVGYRTASELYETQELIANSETINSLNTLFPLCNNYLREFF